MKVLVIIPAYNEESRIGNTISNTLDYTDDIMVVDDGSTDNTASVCKRFDITVLQNETNLGKGDALIKGFLWAYRNEYEAVITLDADGQHSPRHIPDFVERLKSGYDIVIGNRLNTLSPMPKQRIFSNHLVSFLSSIISKKLLRDAQSGYRAIRTAVFTKVPIRFSGFESEIELLMKSARAGFKITHIPISTIYTGEEESKIRAIREIYRFTRMFISEIFNM